MAEPPSKRQKTAESPSTTGTVGFHFGEEDSVTLIVGPTKCKLLVHANYITRNSDFFKAALKKEWREGQTRTITLPTDREDTLRDYLNFTYSSKLPTSHHVTIQTLRSTFESIYEPLAQLYVLGVRLLDDTVRNAVMEEMIRVSQLTDSNGECFIPHEKVIAIVYEGTCEGDPARRLVVDLYVSMAHSSWFTAACEYHPTFMHELTRTMFEETTELPLPNTIREQRLDFAQYAIY